MKFRLRRGQPVRKVVRKLFAFHLERCQSVLQAAPPLPPGQVHEMRKSIKRLRALVALIGHSLGRRRRWFDRQLRKFNRTLAAVRDAEALQEAFDRLATTYDTLPDDCAAVRATLLHWLDQQPPLTVSHHGRAVARLQAIGDQWSHTKLPRRGWKLLAENLEESYRRARQELRRLPNKPSADDWHELRKRVKQVQYHWEFLQPLWPARLTVELEQWEHLSDLLGQHHDAELLRTWLAGPAAANLSPAIRRLMHRRLERLQQQLADQARPLAALCLAEAPRSVTRRLHRYWRIWRTHDETTPSLPSSPAQGRVHEDAVPAAAR